MKVMAYLGFTLLSILVQFCVVDLTKEKINLEDDQIDLNFTSPKKSFEDLLKTFTQKPHALYYRTQTNDNLKDFNSMTLPLPAKTHDKFVQSIELTTTVSSTTLDETFYDENASTTEDALTTESYTSTEFDNITEINFFEKKNLSALKPVKPKINLRKYCTCNLLYQVCDINCCCDNDCTDSEKDLFGSCDDDVNNHKQGPYLCYPYQYFSSGEEGNLVDNLFCIVKTNLPEKRNINLKKYDIASIAHTYKWHKEFGDAKLADFQRKPYMYGEPVWVLREGSIWYIDIPSPTINNYCSGRKPILFLNNVDVKCVVNLKDLEMFQILKTAYEAPCISVTEKSLNTTALNCSTLHCTNWTTVICDDIKCLDYNKSVHEPSCTESHCTNLALQIEYLFYYYDSKIMNATIKLHTKKISTNVPFMNQEIRVRFILTNESIDAVTELSGNPGYIYGRPVISSAAENNRSLLFFNHTSSKYLSHPRNKNGICTSLYSDNDIVLFGTNKRIKCRYVYNTIQQSQNSSNVCNDIGNNIENIFGLNKKTYLSPLGNPLNVKDIDWILVPNNLQEKKLTYGQFFAKKTKLRCYNLVSRISYIFTYADVSEVINKREDKVISANIGVTTQNVSFAAEDISTVITLDINFIDGTKPRTYEYAAGPHINVHLPSDFFFPFRSNAHLVLSRYSVVLMLIICVTCIMK